MSFVTFMRTALEKTLQLIGVSLAMLACAPEPCTPPRCDIRRASCQRELMKATACDRGVAPRDVATRVISLEDYVEEVLEHEQGQQRFDQEAAAMALLGLQEEGGAEEILDAFYASVGAFYDREFDEITVLERGEPLDGFEHSVLMVHEFSHALQHDVSPDEAPTYYTLDALLARSAIFEGDATLTTDRAALRLYGADPDGVAWPDVYRGWAQVERAMLVNAPYRVSLASRYFPYAFGSVFLEPVRRQTGQASIDEWLANPPDSTRAIMAGAKGAADAEAFEATSFDAEAPDAGMADAEMSDASSNASADDAGTDAGRDDTASDAGRVGIPTELVVPQLPGHRLLSADKLGLFVYEVYAHSVAQRLPRRSPLIPQLQGSGAELQADHLSLWVNDETEAPAAVYRLRFADPRLSQLWLEVNAELKLGTHAVRAAVLGGDLVLVSSADEDWLARLDIEQLRWRVMGAAQLEAELLARTTPFADAHICSHKRAPLGLANPR